MIIKKKKFLDLSQNISSNTLFHFTKSFERLAAILRDGFKLSHVPEILPKKTPEGELLYYIAPMVCFCDIPLGGVKVHLRRYGNYGLGIHKSFCMHTNMNPVFYIYDSKAFNSILPEPLRNFSSIIPYVKKYYGKNVKKNENFRFYNEREWRYVKSKEVRILHGDINKIINKCYELDQNPTQYLSFNPSNVEYIILENKSEIYKMVEFIDAYIEISDKEKKILSTKIITATRIKNDF